MEIVEPPAHLSDEARSFLLNPVELEPIDFTDPSVVAAARPLVLEEWKGLNEQITGEWVQRNDTAGGVPVVWYATDSAAFESGRVIVHLHGGSYAFGSAEVASLTVPLAQRTGLPVVSVDYRLAPEHKCPAAVDDAVAACTAIGADKTIVALYGESAGGGLAVATAVALRDAGAAMPETLGLMSPWTDLTTSGDSYRTLTGIDPDFPDPNEPPQVAAAYAGDNVADPQASPLFADLAGLPPALIQVGSREILLSDSLRLDRALRSAGVASTLDVWDGLWHVWQMWHHIPEALTAWDELASFITADRPANPKDN